MNEMLEPATEADATFAKWTAGQVGSELLSPEAEAWRPIPGYDGGYEVSTLGRVRSLKGRSVTIVRQSTSRQGYRAVSLCHKGVARSRRVHHLVLEAFVSARPEGMWGCHANDVPNDNRLENLRWATPAENDLDKLLNGRALRTMRWNR